MGCRPALTRSARCCNSPYRNFARRWIYSVNLAYAAHVTARNFGNQLPTSQVVGRHVFYNNSAFDGSAANNANDDNAIPSTRPLIYPAAARRSWPTLPLHQRPQRHHGRSGRRVCTHAGSTPATSCSKWAPTTRRTPGQSWPDTHDLGAHGRRRQRVGPGLHHLEQQRDPGHVSRSPSASHSHTGLCAISAPSLERRGRRLLLRELRGETASTTPGGSFSRIFCFSDSAAIVSAGTQLSVGINSFMDIDRSNSVIVASDRAPWYPWAPRP